MERKLLDFDPLTGVSHWHNYDHATDEAIITAEQDVSTLLDQNKRAYNESHGKWGELTKVAEIPLVVLRDLEVKGILDDEKLFTAWLNDPENRFFRTRPGTI